MNELMKKLHIGNRETIDSQELQPYVADLTALALSRCPRKRLLGALKIQEAQEKENQKYRTKYDKRIKPLREQVNKIQSQIDELKKKKQNPDLKASEILDIDFDIKRLYKEQDSVYVQISQAEEELKK